MKSKQEIKEELHKLIDSIEDEDTLNMLNEDLVPFILDNRTKENEPADDLTAVQEKELDESIREADAGEVISWDEFLKETKRWLTK